MNLFEIIDEMPVPSAEARMIKEFNAILNKNKDKNIALKELAFIYFFCGFDSRFVTYDDPVEKQEKIAIVVGLSEDWKPDIKVQDAIRRYQDLMNTESMRLVVKQREAIKKLEDFIDTYNPSKENKSGALVFDPLKMQSLIQNMPKMIQALNESKLIVQKELSDKFGGKEVKKRSIATSINSNKFEGQI